MGNHEVALDSNCVTFFLQAMSNGYDPDNDPTDLADERSALLRAFLYTAIAYTLLPVVERELQCISDINKLKDHHSVSTVLMLDPADPISIETVGTRIQELMSFHSGEMDCRALAEAEEIGVPILLTFDKRMLKRLKGEARGVQLMAPSSYFKALRIMPGATPKVVPKKENPLSEMSWWIL